MFHIHVLKCLNEAGHKAYIVGGAIRNQVLGLPVKDYDVTTSATPEQVAKIFPGCDLVGAHFGVCIVKGFNGENVEVATFRKDGNYSDGRRPDNVEYVLDVKDDLSRRDFTINTLVADSNGQISDYFGGMKDLACGIIRCVGNPDLRFQEDALRMLRAIRFSCRLQFYFDFSTISSIKKHAKLLSSVSKERIAIELNGILLSDAKLGYMLLNDLGLFDCISSYYLNPFPSITQEWFDKSLPNQSLLYYLSILCYDTTDWLEFLEDLKYSNEIKDGVIKILWGVELVYPLSQASSAKASKAEFKRFIRQPYYKDIINVFLAIREPHQTITKLLMYEVAYDQEDLWPTPLITGDDLIEAGMKPGPAFKSILYSVETKQLNEEISTKEEAMRYARVWGGQSEV